MLTCDILGVILRPVNMNIFTVFCSVYISPFESLQYADGFKAVYEAEGNIPAYLQRSGSLVYSLISHFSFKLKRLKPLIEQKHIRRPPGQKTRQFYQSKKTCSLSILFRKTACRSARRNMESFLISFFIYQYISAGTETENRKNFSPFPAAASILNSEIFRENFLRRS